MQHSIALLWKLAHVCSHLRAPQWQRPHFQGLTDGWGQVRYAACVAARKFLQTMSDSAKPFYGRLLPRCEVCPPPKHSAAIQA